MLVIRTDFKSKTKTKQTKCRVHFGSTAKKSNEANFRIGHLAFIRTYYGLRN